MSQRSNIFSTTIGLASFHMLNCLTVHPWTPVRCFELFYSGALAKISIPFVFFGEYLCPFVLGRDFAMNSLASSLEFNFNFQVAVSTNFFCQLQCSVFLGHVGYQSHS
ncbi:hypothetical protein DSO57_1002375 [Entomophthora muscae]|uniref:Uncharacterized protein n=1 Tax=Entomophthora muscae TaxID=34485 RepID=A0ACC2RNM6_9FUNG|nr:hypothetical protein DSO57_1002375 [Entomophthora muscae]